MIEIKQGHRMLLPASIASAGNARTFIGIFQPRGDAGLTIEHLRRYAADCTAQARTAARFDPHLRVEGSRFRYWITKEHTRECKRDEAMLLWLYLEFHNDQWRIVDAQYELTRIEPGYGKRYEFLSTGRRSENGYDANPSLALL